MSNRTLRLLIVVSAFQATASCVQTRPARNAVPNENQYLRKDFLTVPANSTTPDPGWWLQGTIVQVSTPNPLGGPGGFYMTPGINSGAIPVRFNVTSDKLQMLSTREMSATDAQSPEVTGAVVNSWPITNVDLMYYVNLDGELTNQYVTNTEAPWQQREFVQVNFDKNDMSDIAPLGEGLWNVISQCVDSANISTTLVPNSFIVDETNNYLQWTVSVTLPLLFNVPACVSAYGDLGQQALALGKQSVTVNLMYSLMRMDPLNDPARTYVPLVLAEKDDIQHKYGPILNYTENLDPTTGLLASQKQVDRFDPTKPIVWYFAQGFNPAYKHWFTDPGTGVVDRTNAILAAAGAKARISVQEYDNALLPGQAPRQYGDIRYNWLVWMSDLFTQDLFSAVTEFNVDYRTGETLSATCAFNEQFFQDHVIEEINAYLLSVGATDDENSPNEWPTTPTIADVTAANNCYPTQAAAGPNSCPINVTAGGMTTPYYCAAGSNVPIQPVTVAATHNGTSTVFSKMQQYLGKPAATFGPLGPADFIAPPSQANDTDFFNAYYAVIPYITYGDPAENPYTIPEGGNGTFGPPSSNANMFSGTNAWSLMQGEVDFQNAAANLSAGKPNMFPTPASMQPGWPYQGASGQASVLELAQGVDSFRTLQQAHHAYQNFQKMQMRHMEGLESVAFETVADQAARSCGTDGTPGAWQTKEQWVNDLHAAFWGKTEFHEFGHAMGLEHNFMGSVDAANWASYPLGNTPQATCDANPLAQGCQPVTHSSSIMEYNVAMADVTFAVPDWGPYDKGAIAWIYANSTPSGNACSGLTAAGAPCSISGQNDAKTPWLDPMGFDSSGNEKRFLYCTNGMDIYTPLCRNDDFGRTPSEIVANQLDSYEWKYQWRNLRSYHKFWDDSAYANGPEYLFTDLQRFVSMWAYDWSASELAVTLHKIGIVNPNPGMQSNGDYYTQLTNKFNAEISAANQMSAAYHVAMINQAQTERPAATTYDPFYGDVTQQGIILDKYFAMQNFAGLWPVMNYDPTQSAGSYLSWYEGLGDSNFNDLTQWGVTTMLGGVPNVFPYFQPTSVALFAQDTHSPAFGNPPQRNWLGGKEFTREQDFLTYFQNIAVGSQYTGAGCVDANGAPLACTCNTTANCTYDPRNISDPNQLNQFVGPDGRRYVWAYITDRGQWVTAEQDTNVITNTIILNFNSDTVAGVDDGNFPGLAYSYELPIKYTADSFIQWN